MAEEERGEKRELEDIEEEEEDESWVGPMPQEAVKTKKRKVLEHEAVYLGNLPSAEMYELSYMHRDVITHLAVTKTNFIVTASQDGHVKFWKKAREKDIEFVKHFRAHIGVIVELAVSPDGTLACTVADDKSMKVFDVVNFDMINMMKLGYTPRAVGWVFRSGDAVAAVAVSSTDDGVIRVYDGRGGGDPVHTLDKLHSKSVTCIKYNAPMEVAVSVDEGGMVEYWAGQRHDYAFPKNVAWQYKTDTDLYDFLKCKCRPQGLDFSPDGKLMATIGTDRKVRVFRFGTGKLTKVLDESLQRFTELQQMKQQLPNMEFGRRMAMERDLEKSGAYGFCNITFDDSGHFLLYATMLGVKVINLHTNRCVKTLGKPENTRLLSIALFQGIPEPEKASNVVTVEMEASDNPALQRSDPDPTLFCTAFKKHRFYMFTRREPDDFKSGDHDRDVFNEKPSKEELVSATQDMSQTKLASAVCLHTSMGDIHLQLFPKECPKTIENFVTHARAGYYNGLIFHRVIKGFMIQTGDPQGTGAGGESIWGGEFEDELHPSLKHDRPYTVSMANAGPNTNGSQFFITVAPTPWLDSKHTVFARVTRGMEIVQNISNVKVYPKTDKPYDEVRVVSITVK